MPCIKPYLNPIRIKPIVLSNIGECFYHLNQLDSASVYLNQALPLAKQI